MTINKGGTLFYQDDGGKKIEVGVAQVEFHKTDWTITLSQMPQLPFPSETKSKSGIYNSKGTSNSNADNNVTNFAMVGPMKYKARGPAKMNI